jgi:hypothetical protein
MPTDEPVYEMEEKKNYWVTEDSKAKHDVEISFINGQR